MYGHSLTDPPTTIQKLINFCIEIIDLQPHGHFTHSLYTKLSLKLCGGAQDAQAIFFNVCCTDV